jgi:hypothetical protein
METPVCKICAARTDFLTHCDFHANAQISYGFYKLTINPSNLILDYFICPSCGFVFTNFMDGWGDHEFSTYVYNKDYPRLDGSYNGLRSGASANMFYLAFHENISKLEFLDYGGGMGIQSIALEASGAKRAVTYDPFSGKARPEGRFNMVCAQEVLEHTIDPRKTVADLVSFANHDNGLIFMSSNCPPADIREQKDKWWYMTPRIGHVSFYPNSVVDTLLGEHGYKVIHMMDSLHIAYRQWPLWARDFLPMENRTY